MSSQTTKLEPHEVEKIKQRFPELPDAYLDYLGNVGWGDTESGRMIYSGPVFPTEMYPSSADNRIVLLGDDHQGYCLAYDLGKKEFGEISDSGEWEDWGPSDTFEAYVG